MVLLTGADEFTNEHGYYDLFGVISKGFMFLLIITDRCTNILRPVVAHGHKRATKNQSAVFSSASQQVTSPEIGRN